LKTEDDSEIKAEIERRLNLLEPNPFIQIRCRVCKKFFQTKKKRVFKPKICPECLTRHSSQK
jgi:Zn finger protein HypA/HybF involved in hydrogenase expression